MKFPSMHERCAPVSRAAGFTLVELMIVVLIVGILAAIATPTYVSYVARTNRGAAKGCMAEFSQFMERYYTTNLTYVGAAPVLGCQTESQLNLKYTIDVTTTAATQRTYMVTATPQGVCENWLHDATRWPFSSAARRSFGRCTRRPRRSCARAQFTRHTTARVWTAAGADASLAELHALSGARYAFQADGEPSARPTTRMAKSDTTAKAIAPTRTGAAAAAELTVRTMLQFPVWIRPQTE